jgi:hypothetical protein
VGKGLAQLDGDVAAVHHQQVAKLDVDTGNDLPAQFEVSHELEQVFVGDDVEVAQGTVLAV